MRFFGEKQQPVKSARAKGAQGFGAPLRYSWGFRELPGAGAGQYAFETMALPMYATIGPSVGNRNAWQYHQAVVAAVQGVNLYAIGSPGVLTGGMYNAPLSDTETTLPADVQAALQAVGNANYMIPRA